jgi:post-segregation antitoxin (ccd killing protein)
MVISLCTYRQDAGVPQISIYLPDELAEQLRARKGTLNLSQLFQQAVRQELGKLTRTEIGEADLQALIERLRSQKQEHASQWRTEGIGDADRWIKTADYEELKQFGEMDLNAKLKLPEDIEETLEETRRDLLEEGQLVDWEAYTLGWHSRVREVWEQIKDEL